MALLPTSLRASVMRSSSKNRRSPLPEPTTQATSLSAGQGGTQAQARRRSEAEPAGSQASTSS
eukprot:309641-Hanusia_phi.AAC.1